MDKASPGLVVMLGLAETTSSWLRLYMMTYTLAHGDTLNTAATLIEAVSQNLCCSTWLEGHLWEGREMPLAKVRNQSC